jgi:hypothetical protein
MAYTSVIANEKLHKVCKPAAATRKLIKKVETRISCKVVAFHKQKTELEKRIKPKK